MSEYRHPWTCEDCDELEDTVEVRSPATPRTWADQLAALDAQ